MSNLLKPLKARWKAPFDLCFHRNFQIIFQEVINKARWYFNGEFAFYQRQLNLPMERRIALRERFVRELVEFFSNYKGKLFGTAAWRRMIGKPESLVTLFFFLHFM